MPAVARQTPPQPRWVLDAPPVDLFVQLVGIEGAISVIIVEEVVQRVDESSREGMLSRLLSHLADVARGQKLEDAAILATAAHHVAGKATVHDGEDIAVTAALGEVFLGIIPVDGWELDTADLVGIGSVEAGLVRELMEIGMEGDAHPASCNSFLDRWKNPWPA